MCFSFLSRQERCDIDRDVSGADFYWLGRVPCRTVCLIGLVVGLQVFESKILYSSE